MEVINMAFDKRLNLTGGYLPNFYSEETRIGYYLEELQTIVSNKIYRKVFDVLLEGDKYSLANLITGFYKKIRDYQAEISKYKAQVERQEELIERLQKQVEELKEQTERFPIQSKSKFSFKTLKKMVTMYEDGASLNAIAATFGCDKSTVKRYLIKMGVTIRPK